MKHPTIKLDESVIDFHFQQWRLQLMENPRPDATPPSFIQYLEGQLQADTNYRITGRDFLSFIKRIGGKDENPQG